MVTGSIPLAEEESSLEPPLPSIGPVKNILAQPDSHMELARTGMRSSFLFIIVEIGHHFGR